MPLASAFWMSRLNPSETAKLVYPTHPVMHPEIGQFSGRSMELAAVDFGHPWDRNQLYGYDCRVKGVLDIV
ncbi:MAG: hypothetical protein CMH52_06450 [Myxococcales bacterium]|nr:hypothetical protein [Myxococcales bacterium]|tara:strand:- start:924 stop:1136 length:213 start_codon:yes stop_codon:yes gene_type:complete